MPGLVRTSRQVVLLGQGNNPTSPSGQGSPPNLPGLGSNQGSNQDSLGSLHGQVVNQDSLGSLHGKVVNQDNKHGQGSHPNSPSGLVLNLGNPHGLASLASRANPQPQDGPVQPQVQVQHHQQQLRGL